MDDEGATRERGGGCRKGRMDGGEDEINGGREGASGCMASGSGVGAAWRSCLLAPGESAFGTEAGRGRPSETKLSQPWDVTWCGGEGEQEEEADGG